MHMIFGKKQRAKQMARTDKQVEDILAPAEARAALAKKEASQLNRLIAKSNGDLTIKLYLAVNWRDE